LRAKAADPQVRRLMDAQETLLTRLDLLDPANRAEAEAFLRSLRQADVARRVGEAVQKVTVEPAVRAWLVESEVFLVGAERGYE